MSDIVLLNIITLYYLWKFHYWFKFSLSLHLFINQPQDCEDITTNHILYGHVTFKVFKKKISVNCSENMLYWISAAQVGQHM